MVRKKQPTTEDVRREAEEMLATLAFATEVYEGKHDNLIEEGTRLGLTTIGQLYAYYKKEREDKDGNALTN